MILLLMGVSGSGKTTLGRLAAAELGMRFVDADDYHPPANVARMRAGLPLDEADRAPWLAALRQDIDQWLSAGESVVFACSALTAASRQALGAGRTDFRTVLLTGAADLIAARMQARAHFMPASLLASQLALLEPPADALVLDIARTPAELTAEICQFQRR